jgi:hypothetical protein
MNIASFRHHVLEGLRSFVLIGPPNNCFQQGVVDALEHTLRFIDEVELPWDVFYGGTHGNRVGLSEAEIGELCVGQYKKDSADLSKMASRSTATGGHVLTTNKLRKRLQHELRLNEYDPYDTEYTYGYRAGIEELRRVMDGLPCSRLNFKFPAPLNAERTV